MEPQLEPGLVKFDQSLANVHDREEVFEALRTEWVDLVESERRTVRQTWTSAMASMQAEYLELLNTGAWVQGPVDFFGVVGLSRSEVHHSAMIAWLLDPSARHGMGGRIADGLLRRFFPGDDWTDARVRSVECEVARGDTRADIVIWAEQFTMVIENKVDAAEGPNQCLRLYQRFRDEINPMFVFLSPSGRRPRTATGDATGMFVPISYGDFRSILDKAIDSCGLPPGPGRDICENYLVTLKEQFG